MITFLSILVGAWIGVRFSFSAQLVLAGMIGFLVCAFGNVVNDLYDIEIDRINNPSRPLPSGRVTDRGAKIFGLVLSVIAILFAFSLGLFPVLVVVFALVLLFAYAVNVKRTIFGNFVVAFITGLSFVLGGLVNRNVYCIIPFIFSFFIHLPREIIKDVIDLKGDKASGVSSLPILKGETQALNLAAIFLVLLCLILPLPFILQILGRTYMFLVLILAYPFVIYTIIRLLRKPEQTDLKRVSNMLKVTMVTGLLAMVL